jgi:tetratricopeptide (TPR) repeat protein
MRSIRDSVVGISALLAACASNPDRHTLAELHDVPADTQDVEVEGSLDMAMQSYRRFLEETSTGRMTPEAMRRLADLQLEKEYGINVDTRVVELAAPERAAVRDASASAQEPSDPSVAGAAGATAESDQDFERRATQELTLVSLASTEATPASAADASAELALPGGDGLARAGPLQAIEIYKQLLEQYPSYERNDQVLYQMSRAYDELGRTEEAMSVMERFISAYAYSKYLDEVQFRRGEYFFTRRHYRDAEAAYGAIIAMGAQSSYYELALYKLGWTLYKQEFYEEALHRYMALLDYKLSVGYDFDARHEEEDERRVADTFHVISLSFSNLGGPDVVAEYYTTYGGRSYEDRIYRNLGEFYLEKLRYQDAAAVYGSFVKLHPLHRVAPHFSMRVIEIYEKGDFPKLVVESKKAFATDYGLQAEYWRHFDVEESPEVLSYLKRNLRDLANHYHALYQDKSLEAEKPANYREALVWYRQYLASFPLDPESPSINYQVADLLLENRDFGEAAREYERTAYDYPPHDRASAAGYAAIYAHREQLKAATEEQRDDARRATVASSLRFADTFPEHEHAAVVLGAASQDLYEMKDFELAAASGQKLVDRYPAADAALRRSAWTVVAHSSFELERYPEAGLAYTRVLELAPEGDAERAALVDNLAASVYKQGELANALGDYRSAADHYLRLKDVAPTSGVRPAAEYDAAAALMRLQDWGKAAEVLDDFRTAFPEHELQREATKQLAFAYREGGEAALAAGEYERVAAETDDAELGREALLTAGELHEQSGDVDRALAVYVRYVERFPQPVEAAIETRFKIAGMYDARGDSAQFMEELQEIVAADAAAGAQRTNRTKYLAARSGLVLAEGLYAQFEQVRLVQPFEQSLATKRERMDAAVDSFEGLIDYEVAEVTAAATYYMAEIYWGFNRSLIESERPAGLDAAEAAEYDDAIEEEAYPFEEQAIEVHEKNRELIVAGVYNDWTKKSLAKLAELVPGRYAKQEQSSGFLPAIDVYAYRSPSAPDPNAVAQANGAAAPPAEADAASDETLGDGDRIQQAAAPEAHDVTL